VSQSVGRYPTSFLGAWQSHTYVIRETAHLHSHPKKVGLSKPTVCFCIPKPAKTLLALVSPPEPTFFLIFHQWFRSPSGICHLWQKTCPTTPLPIYNNRWRKLTSDHRKVGIIYRHTFGHGIDRPCTSLEMDRFCRDQPEESGR